MAALAEGQYVRKEREFVLVGTPFALTVSEAAWEAAVFEVGRVNVNKKHGKSPSLGFSERAYLKGGAVFLRERRTRKRERTVDSEVGG